MTGFYRMSRVDAIVLIIFGIISIFLFLPWSLTTKIGGIVFFGWGMGALMFVAPILGLIALAASAAEKKGGTER